MRDILTVIDQVKNKVPVTEKDLLARLTEIKFSAEFSSPELMMDYWNNLSEVMQKSVPIKFTQNWHPEVIAIFMDKSVEDVVKLFGRVVNNENTL